MPLIEIKNAQKRYGKPPYDTYVLKDLNLTVEKGEMLAVMGKSGCGKSTLLNIIGGLDTLDEGEYIFKGERVSKLLGKKLLQFRQKNIGFIIQYYALIKDLTVFDNIALPLRFDKVNYTEIKNRVNDISRKLGIQDKLDSYCYALSGGESQRAAIARALVKEHSCLLADEPTGSLDEENSGIILDLFSKLNKEGETIIMVTHDPGNAAKCGRIIHMQDGFLFN